MLRFNQSNGFALPLVLGISTLLVVLIISIGSSVTHKIHITGELNARLNAELKAYSAFNDILYKLNTSTLTPTDVAVMPDMDYGRTSLPAGRETGITLLNLFGEPITLEEGVTVTLRDTAGMVDFMTNTRLLEILLNKVVPDVDQIAVILDSLADWQDKDDFKHINGAELRDYRLAGYSYVPRNSYVQSIEELRLIKGMSPPIFDRIRPELVYGISDSINYLTMSEFLLSAVLRNEKTLEQVLQLRRNRLLTRTLFSAISGISETEESTFYPSGKIVVEIAARVDPSVERLQFTLLKKESQDKPFVILEWNR